MENSNSIKWAELVEFYRRLVEDHNWKIAPFLDLVKSIEASPFSQSLLSSNSHETLFVSISKSGLENYPRLRIDFLKIKQEFKFTYQDGPNYLKWWTRKVNGDEGFLILKRFLIKRARWFKELT